ncbi:unnamed protein product [Ambrosiozyma monospora]|uniref:Unnamed protein product n=1 Tax=Ambrosiozyma monospora TaxID=43982 RepID=A0ACB5U9G8_AMBMO|nr:unnamed protein product [Ambrosiozyma monospora]
MILSNAYLAFGRNVTISIVSMVGQVIYTETLRSNLKKVDVSSLAPGQDLMVLVSETSLLSKLSSDDKAAVRHAVMKSIKNVFYMLLGSACLALICALLMSDAKLPRKEDVEQHIKENANESSDDTNEENNEENNEKNNESRTNNDKQ